MIPNKIISWGEGNAWQLGTRHFFSTEGRHLSPLNFRWVHLSVFITFSGLDFLLHFDESLCLVFTRTGDHKIPEHRFWFQVAWNIEKEVTKKKKKKGDQHLAFKRGFL